MKRIAIYPGSFDPITNGHLDILKRASNLFDEVIVAIGTNSNKIDTFTVAERKEMIENAIKHLPNCRVDVFSTLTVEYAKSQKAQAIIRGLRALNDFEYEFQMALMNQKLAANIEMVFLMASKEHTFISSSLIKELARHEGNVKDLVPEIVLKFLKQKYLSDEKKH